MKQKRYVFEFTEAEVDQLMAYHEDRDSGADAGWYFGNKDAFEKRHVQIRLELFKRQVKP